MARLASSGAASTTSARESSRPLRILTFTSIYPNDLEPAHGLFVRERVRALARLAEAQVMAPIPAVPPLPGLPRRYSRLWSAPVKEIRDGVVVHHPRFATIPRVLKWTDPFFIATACAPRLLAVRREFPFDVIDAHWACPDGVAAAFLSRITGVPFSLTVRGDDINVFSYEAGRRRLIAWALQRAAIVIALSRELAARCVELGTPSDRVAIVPNGIDVNRFRPLDRRAVRRRLGIAERVRVLLSVGRLHSSKGFATLVDALGSLGEQDSDIRLVIVGEVDHEADPTTAITEAIERHQLFDRVLVTGAQSPQQLVDWYNAADLFCLATTREGSANVLFEALACGLPCITTDVGGNRETIADDRYGLLTSPDVQSFARTLREGLDRRWNRHEIAEYGRSRGWNVVAQECYDLLRTMVQQKVPGA